MLRRSILCGAFAVACVFPCVAYAQETEAKFWRNAADVAAYQDMVCMSKFGLPVPPFLDDVVECTDQDGNTTFNTEMLGASILGLGAGGRVYNISSGPDNDLYVEVGGEKGFLEQVPGGYGNPIDMVTTGAPHLVRFAGLDVALNEVLVLTSTGVLLHWDPRLYPNGWTEVVRGIPRSFTRNVAR